MSMACASITIDRPIDEVFAVISDVENDPKYSSQVVEAQRTTPGPIAVGSRGQIVTKVMGRRVASTGEVTEFEPYRRYGWRLTSGPVPLSGSITFSIGDCGTQVDATIEATPRGLLRIAGPLFAAIAGRQLWRDLTTCKKLMEAGRL
jgi:uncharacterized membrane protein